MAASAAARCDLVQVHDLSRVLRLVTKHKSYCCWSATAPIAGFEIDNPHWIEMYLTRCSLEGVNVLPYCEAVRQVMKLDLVASLIMTLSCEHFE